MKRIRLANPGQKTQLLTQEEVVAKQRAAVQLRFRALGCVVLVKRIFDNGNRQGLTATNSFHARFWHRLTGPYPISPAAVLRKALSTRDLAA